VLHAVDARARTVDDRGSLTTAHPSSIVPIDRSV
jgi:hypothetical protein